MKTTTAYVAWVRHIGVTGWTPQIRCDSRETLEYQIANVRGPYSILILPEGEFPWVPSPPRCQQEGGMACRGEWQAEHEAEPAFFDILCRVFAVGVILATFALLMAAVMVGW